MTFPPGADLTQAVLPGGSVTLPQIFETYYGSGQPQPVSAVTITVTPASGGTPVLGPTGTGIIPGDGAAYSYTWTPPADLPPGDYLAVWSASGESGPLTYTQVVTVATPPSLTPAPGVYATGAQYQAETGDQYTPAQLVQATLRRASAVIDRAMNAAWYRVDANGMPVDPGVIGIFARATCLQAQFMLANNDPANVKLQFASTNVGGVNLTRTASAQGQVFPPLAPAAAEVLVTTGALPGAPLLGFLCGGGGAVTMEIANTRVTVLRGTSVDFFNDPVDLNEPAAEGIPAFLGETGKTVQDPSTSAPRTIREVTAQVPGWAAGGIKNTDRIRDEGTGDIYIVLSVTQPSALFGNPADWNQVLQLKRVSAAGT